MMLDLMQLRAQFGFDLTPEQTEHVEKVITEMAYRIYSKYAAGQREHGGDLWKKSIVLEEALNEVTDFNVYLLTLKQQIQDSGIQLGDPSLSDTNEESR